jgi:elongation factor Ts
MSEITTEQVKQLRDETKVSVMKCKKALEEAGGDMEKAKIILRKESANAADKKADRDLGAGVVGVYQHTGGAVGSMVELLCETDFVSKNEDFQNLAREIAMHVAAQSPEFVRVEDVKEEDKEKARELFTKEAEDKPEEMREKIVEGKLASFLSEKVLLDQKYIKNPDQTIGDLLNEATQKFGERVDIGRISRFSITG